MKPQLGVYGRVGITRAWCDACSDTAFVLDGAMACCGEPTDVKPVHWKRISEPEYRRKVPCLTEQQAILDEQGHRCFYCDQPFGALLERKGRLTKLKVNWDHSVPYSFNANNDVSNFVAACHVCNGWKSDMVFDTVEAARVYLRGRWDREQAKEDRRGA